MAVNIQVDIQEMMSPNRATHFLPKLRCCISFKLGQKLLPKKLYRENFIWYLKVTLLQTKQITHFSHNHNEKYFIYSTIGSLNCLEFPYILLKFCGLVHLIKAKQKNVLIVHCLPFWLLERSSNPIIIVYLVQKT